MPPMPNFDVTDYESCDLQIELPHGLSADAVAVIYCSHCDLEIVTGIWDDAIILYEPSCGDDE